MSVLFKMAHLPPSVAMNVVNYNINNYDNIRRRKSSLSNVSFRNTSVFSSTSSILWHKRIVINNKLPNQEHVEPIDNSQLLYSGDSQENNQDSTATVPSTQ